MKKEIRNLTNEELKKVFNANAKLQQEVMEDIEESEMFWISEYLNCFKDSLSNWSIGFYNGNFITVQPDKEIEFLNGVLKAQKDFCFLKDEFTEITKNLINKYYQLDESQYEEDKQSEFDVLQIEIEEEFENIQSEVLNQFNIHTDFNSEDAQNYFIEFYVDARLDENCYIDENFILYEDISYSKCYK